MAEKTIKVPPEVRAYMSQIGAKKTEAKARSSRQNAEKAKAAARKNPLDLPCVCGGGDSLKASDHKTTCPRGHLLWQRERAAQKKAEKEAATI